MWVIITYKANIIGIYIFRFVESKVFLIKVIQITLNNLCLLEEVIIFTFAFLELISFRNVWLFILNVLSYLQSLGWKARITASLIVGKDRFPVMNPCFYFNYLHYLYSSLSLIIFIIIFMLFVWLYLKVYIPKNKS